MVVTNLWLALVGLFAGVLGGLLGIGGSIVMIPAMTELLGPQQHLFQAAALIVNFFVAAPSVLQHQKRGAIDRRLVAGMIPTAMFGSVVGVACSELPLFHGTGSLYLTGLFGLFLFLVAFREGRRWLAPARSESPQDGDDGQPLRVGRAAWMVALPTGFVSGLLGVGGGIVAVPLQRRILHVPLRKAIANSAAMIVGLSLTGAAVKHYALAVHHSIPLLAPSKLALFLIPTAMLGAFWGSRLTHTLAVGWVRGAFVLLLIAAGVRMEIHAVGILW